MIRLMIADDHAIMREGLKQLFGLVGDFTVVAEATDGGSVLEKLRSGGIDILLLDMTMPGICGENLVARVRAHYPTLPILILSMHNEPQIAQRALKAGANGYLTKDRDPETLISAIRRVASGGRFLDPQLAESMAFQASRGGAQASHESLTERELEIMRMIARGLSINEIADTLSISNKTVSTHKARLMEKMGFSSTAELVRYSLENRLVD